MAWSGVEAQLGLQLPDDYKLFVDFFGAGTLIDFFHVFTPDARSSHTDLRLAGESMLAALRDIRESEGLPHPVHPEPQGLLPWGRDDNGNFLLWRTGASEWSVVIGAARDEKWVEYSMCMTDFLLQVVGGTISPSVPGRLARVVHLAPY
ncbi:MAG: SMI1/KNR4 family protein [Polyangiaceae bacterium]